MADAPSLDRVFAPDGMLARRHDGWEDRPQQRRLAEAVTGAIAAGRHLVAEAGTGTGKSLAYLVPTIRHACESGRRVIISTHTINLGEQLVHKDLPLLRSALPLEFTVVLGMGRNNYLCRRRLEQARARDTHRFDAAMREELERVSVWADRVRRGEGGRLGTRTEMDPTPASEVWSAVRAEHGNCMGRKSPFYNECFWQQARNRMQNANVLVVNHHLFFADLALRANGVHYLPDYDTVVLDEAHNLESVAAEHLGTDISSGQVAHLLDQLWQPVKGAGLLAAAGTPRAREAVDDCRRAADEFFESVSDWYGRGRDGAGRFHGRVDRPHFVPDPLSPTLDHLAGALREVERNCEDEADRTEIRAHRERAAALAQGVEESVGVVLPDQVYWVEAPGRRSRRRRVALKSAPVWVAPLLRRHLFETTRCVIMTSATLALPGPDGEPDCTHFRERVGLEEADELVVDSPFDYGSNVRVILEESMPEARAPAWPEAASRRILHWIDHTDGGAFVLFTSYRAMEEVRTRTAETLRRDGRTLLVQGQGMPRHAMLERFRDDENAVLFGTDSFWQGVDVPGRALRNVIVTQLPFAVPTHPLQEARSEDLKRRGRDPFRELSLPEAVLRFKQGFGRLIRSSRDAGIVVVLDPRIRTRSYGRAFLAALPDCPVTAGETLEEEDFTP